MLSLVIPVYNEEKLIPQLLSESKQGLESITSDYEIICVDDGSKDHTLELLLSERLKDKRVKVLVLSRNFGHQAAYTAGLSMATGDHVAMMDGDLQDPPKLLPVMYEKLVNEEYDVVFGSRKTRQEPLVKRLLIKSFHGLFSQLSNINAPPNVGNFSVMNRDALDAFLALQEKNRYLPGLRFFIGFKQGYVEYDRPDRAAGSSMSYSGLFRLALDAIFSFSKLPIRICLAVGLIGLIVSIGGACIVLAKKINGEAITGWASTMLSIYLLASVQLLFLGVIGEYVHRIFVEVQNRPVFIVKKYFN